MVWHNIVINRPKSNGDSYFVNSEIKLTGDMQKPCNTGTQNDSKENHERLSSIETGGRSPSSSFN